MKLRSLFRPSLGRFSATLAPLLLAGAVSAEPAASNAAPTTAPAPTPAPASSSPAPTAAPAATTAPNHIFFMGADITTEYEKKYYPVEYVSDEFLFIKPADKLEKVKKSRNHSVRIADTMRLSDSSVEISSLLTKPSYTAAADPKLKFQHAASINFALTDQADYVQKHEDDLRQEAQSLKNDPHASTATVNQAQSKLQEWQNSHQAVDTSNYVTDETTASVRELYDAIEISFEVMPSTDLKQAYYLIRTFARPQKSKPDETQEWTCLSPLGKLTAGIRYPVSVFLSGFPPGYIFEGCEIHIYNHGTELATNLSRNRAVLSDDEVFQYHIVEYIVANKGKTLPASLYSATIPADLREKLTPDQLSTTFYVRIGKPGTVDAAFTDAAASSPVSDESLLSALKRLRFKPALQAGKPVEAVAPVTLSQLPAS